MKQNKIDLDRVVDECKRIANEQVRNWKPFDKTWKTIEGSVYLRLSTEEQVRVDKGSLEQQIWMAVLEAETRSKQKKINYRITAFFIEPGISGRMADRKELKTLMKGITAQKFQFVVIKEISRLTRDSGFWKEFFKLCQIKKCEIVIKGLPFDPNDPASILQLDILASFAEFESRTTAKRISESVFSAMKTSGKFNSTHRRLGLIQLIEGGRPRPGFYQRVEPEILTVLFIFKTFNRYASHNKTLEVLNDKGIKNWNGEPFQRHSLINLLTDTRYISKWYLNKENKDKDQDDLPEKERYYEITLPHEPVVPIELWDETQKTAMEVAGNLGKTTRVDKIYPLTGGLLQFEDGSPFRGTSGTGRTQKSFYYYNKKNNIRIKCDLIDSDVARAVTKLVQNSPALQKAISNAGSEVQDSIQRLQTHLQDLKTELKSLDDGKAKEMKKLDLLIVGNTDSSDVDLFRREFRDVINRNQDKHQVLTQQIDLTQKGIESLKAKSFSWTEVAGHATRVQEILKEKDPVALKRAYYSLFDSILVGPEDSQGHRSVTYVLKNWDGSIEDISRLRAEMVEAPGVEPGSVSDSH